MVRIQINSEVFFFNENFSILEACELVGIKIPRFCYHPSLSIAGNCRMCLVYLDMKELLVISCLTPIEEDMIITCSGSGIEKARESVIEFLLLNHPLDCPICDQGGECDLQDQAKKFGSSYSKLFINKSTVEDKYFNPFIKTIMTRCIHCTRCVRFNAEIIGFHFFSTLNRGGSTEIGTYFTSIIDSEISGNVIDLCPVGALTSKTYAFKIRPWELRSTESIDISDSIGSNIYVHHTEHEIQKVLPKLNSEINEYLISDKARFSYDCSKVVSNENFIIEHNDYKSTPILGLQKSYLKTKLLDNLNLENKKLFLISEESSLEYLNFIKKISYEKKNIIIKLINSKSKSYNNWYFNKENLISNINVSESSCFLIAINPRLEATLINTKIRLLTLRQNYNIYNFGYKYNSFTKTNFINFDVSQILSFLEGKSLNISSFFLNDIRPLILFGSSLTERISNINFLKYYVKKINPSFTIFNVLLWSNSASIEYLGIKTVHSNDIRKAKFLILSDIVNNYYTQKYILDSSLNKTVINFNSFISSLNFRNGYDVKIKNFFEKSEIFLNLEFRPQQTQKVLKESKSFCSYSLLTYLLNLNNKKNNFLNHTFFINEIINNSTIFSKFLKKKYSNFFFFEDKNLLKTKISTYVFKPQAQCFYTLNYFSRYSLFMLKASKEYQQTSNNFYK